MLWTSQVFTFWKHPWTPKARAGLVSLHDLFVHAEDIADLDVSAPERIALTRLLVGITHAALGAPDSPEQWAEFSCDIAHAVPAYLSRPEVLPHFNLLGAGPRFLQKQPPALGIRKHGGQPLQLINAFENPVRAKGGGFAGGSEEELRSHLAKIETIWGPQGEQHWLTESGLDTFLESLVAKI